MKHSNPTAPSLQRARLVAALCAIGAFGASGCVPIAIIGGTAGAANAVAEERSVGDSFDDATTDANIKRLLFQSDGFYFSDLDVTIYEGRVMLTGTTPREEDRIEAGKIAWNGGGVAEVINEIEIADKTGIPQGTEDALIETRLRSRLTLDENVKSINYKITVSRGAVYLLGVAIDTAELTRVTEHARNIKGVTKVVSHVQLKDDPRRR